MQRFIDFMWFDKRDQFSKEFFIFKRRIVRDISHFLLMKERFFLQQDMKTSDDKYSNQHYPKTQIMILIQRKCSRNINLQRVFNSSSKYNKIINN